MELKVDDEWNEKVDIKESGTFTDNKTKSQHDKNKRWQTAWLVKDLLLRQKRLYEQ